MAMSESEYQRVVAELKGTGAHRYLVDEDPYARGLLRADIDTMGIKLLRLGIVGRDAALEATGRRCGELSARARQIPMEAFTTRTQERVTDLCKCVTDDTSAEHAESVLSRIEAIVDEAAARVRP